MICLIVPGVAVPQGSMTHLGRGRVKYRDDLKPWRNKVRGEYVRQASTQTFSGPVSLELAFVLPRPKNHYGTGANAGHIKASAQVAHHAVAPDLDKLCRAINDALTLNKGDLAGLPRPFDNDAQITHITATKRYIQDGETPHTVINIRPAYA